MPKQHTVQAGECVNSIADQYGFFWRTVWDDGANAQLKALRKDHGTLVPGDVLSIPDKREKEEVRPTGAVHKFQKLGVPAKIRVQLFDGDEPRIFQAFTIQIDGKSGSGTTDAKGVLEWPIPPNAKEAVVTIGRDGAEFSFRLGRIEPITELKGVQARLNNLGYLCEPVDGALNEQTRAALTEFQVDHGLTASGEADGATRQRLAELHDRVGDIDRGNGQGAQ